MATHRAMHTLWKSSNPCILCPRQCKVYRGKDQTGYCGIGKLPRVSSVGPHFGEESVLVGRGGSGTIFFAGCNLKCLFCQNYDISHQRKGEELSVEELAQRMLQLQAQGCSNINLVTPTHVVAAIIEAIVHAKAKGLKLPIVYNSGGYDLVATLKLLNGFIDVYMPDMKYSNAAIGMQLSDAPDYPQVNRAAVKEMHRQVGDLRVEGDLAIRGLLVRHLVLPNGLAGSIEIIDFLTKAISRSTAINIMGQYHPCFGAFTHKFLNRRPYPDEVESVRSYAIEKGLNVL
jgi:putative pyruvate formate lyase activating enzyme